MDQQNCFAKIKYRIDFPFHKYPKDYADQNQIGQVRQQYFVHIMEAGMPNDASVRTCQRKRYKKTQQHNRQLIHANLIQW